MNAVEARKAQDAARARGVKAAAKIARRKIRALDRALSFDDVEAPGLVATMEAAVDDWESRFGQVGVSNHSQDGATVIGGRCLFRLVPRLAGWVREIQKKAGAHGAIRVVEIDGRTFLEPTKEK